MIALTKERDKGYDFKGTWNMWGKEKIQQEIILLNENRWYSMTE